MIKDLENYRKAKLVHEAEAKVQIARWDETTILGGLTDDYVRGEMAILLENQRLINETDDSKSESSNWTVAQFKRVSIPLVRRVYDPKACLIWDLTSLQTMLGPRGYACFSDVHFEDVFAYTKKYKTLWEFPVHDNNRSYDMLAREFDATVITAIEICNEINEELIGDLFNNVGIHEEIKWNSKPEDIWEFLSGSFYRFEHSIEPNKPEPFGKKPNWIVTNESLANELKKVADFKPIEKDDAREKLSCKRTGTLQGMALIECKDLLHNDILFGYKGDNFESGYAWLPYVPFSQYVSLDPDTFTPKSKVIARYGKKLAEGGKHFYAKLTVQGFNKEKVK